MSYIIHIMLNYKILYLFYQTHWPQVGKQEEIEMKVLIIGATGTIGKAVSERLSKTHEVVRAGYSDGEYRVDLGSKTSIEALFNSVGTIDAVVSTAGVADFAPFDELNDDAFDRALNNKLMGQINLVRVGLDHLSDGGSFTLTAGILARQPMPGTVAISMANGGLESFVRAAALELDRDIRVNTVSPVFVKETMEMMGMDPTPGLSAADTAKAYEAAVQGNQNGETLDAPDYV